MDYGVAHLKLLSQQIMTARPGQFCNCSVVMAPTVPWHDAGVAYQMFKRFPDTIAVVAIVWNIFIWSMLPLTPVHGGVE
jgi:hypothetical protein